MFLTLRAVHVLAGALWVGAAVMNAAFVIPSIMAAGPAGGQVMRILAQVRRLPVFINTVMVTSIVSGLLLYWADSGGLQWEWMTSGMGLTFAAGATLALVTAGIAQWVTVPSVRRLGALGAAVAGAGGVPTPVQVAEMAALQRRLLGAARVGATLVVLALILMSLASYV
jgi:hypothetical protein